MRSITHSDSLYNNARSAPGLLYVVTMCLLRVPADGSTGCPNPTVGPHEVPVRW